MKLSIHTLAHEEVGLISSHLPESFLWKIIFWLGLILLAFGGWLLSSEKQQKVEFDNETCRKERIN
ncbi:hypothetical protein ACSVDA_09280 [Cytobacillus sp. Hm23]